MNHWDCSTCDMSSVAYEQRGCCGGPLLPTLPRSSRDEAGRVYIEGRRLMPTSLGEAFREDRFYSCPVGEALNGGGWVSQILSVYRHSKRGERISEVLKEPSVAAWEVIDLLNAEVALVDKLDAQHAEERAKIHQSQAATRGRR